MAQRIIATMQETIAIHDALRAALSANGDGTYSYSNSQSDETIATTVAPRLSPAHVARIRTEMFGKLGKAPEPTPLAPADIAAQMTNLDNKLTEALEAVGALRSVVAELRNDVGETNALIRKQQGAF